MKLRSVWKTIRRIHRILPSRKSAANRIRRLAIEGLELRAMLAAVTVDLNTFRTDEFTISGSFSYSEIHPEYEDVLPSGTFTSESAQLVWSSPSKASGSIQAETSGSGSDRGFVLGGWHGCSEYTTEERGSLDISVDAAARTLRVRQTPIDSVVYTHYRDVTGRRLCPQGDPWYRFFTGSSDGTFDAVNKTLSREYRRTGGSIRSSTIPVTSFHYINNSPTDASLIYLSAPPESEIPSDWETVSPSSTSSPIPSYDASQNSLQFQIEITGRAFTPGANVAQPVGRLRLYWAENASTSRNEEIPITTGTNDLAYFWNTEKLHVRVETLLEPPDWARYLYARLDSTVADAKASNDAIFLPIIRAELPGSQTVARVDAIANGVHGNLLHSEVAIYPNTRVVAYSPISEMNVPVQVFNDSGAFVYKSTSDLGLEYLGKGEQVPDRVSFMVIRNGVVSIYADHTILLEGVNDSPIATDDFFSTADNQELSIPGETLLVNDWDVDVIDTIALDSIAAMSELGVPLTTDSQGQIHYNPRVSPQLYALSINESAQDTFTYKIKDPFGVTATATATITVMGANDPPAIGPMGTQFTVMDTSKTIPLSITDGDDNLADVQVSAVSNDGSIVQTEVSGIGASRSLVITPVESATGKTLITVYAQDPSGGSTSVTFLMVVGTSTDADLDGVADSIEDAAPNGGDMNHDGVPDRHQVNVASTSTANSLGYINVAVADSVTIDRIVPQPAPAITGEAAGVEFPVGLVRVEVSVPYGGSQSIHLQSSFQNAPLNTCFQYETSEGAGATWHRMIFDQSQGAHIYADRITIDATDGGSFDLDGVADGHIILNIGLGSVSDPWHNLIPEDVNNDGVISPIDALLIINALNRNTDTKLLAKLAAGQEIPHFLDVSGDRVLSAIDALIVINWLNQ